MLNRRFALYCLVLAILLASASWVAFACEPSGPSGEPKAQPSSNQNMGRLEIVVNPWANVKIDGKPAGKTPMSPRYLTPGVHEVELKNPQLKKSKVLKVTIEPDKKKTLRVDLRKVE